MHIDLKIEDDALNRRQPRLCVSRTIYHIYQGQSRPYSGKCACVYVYAVWI